MNNYDCINWRLTGERYGYTERFRGISFKPIVCVCQQCSTEFETKYNYLAKRSGPFCNKCVKLKAGEKKSSTLNSLYATSDFRQRVAAGVSSKWDDVDFRLRCTTANAINGSYEHSQTHKDNASAAIKAKWLDQEYRSIQDKLRSDSGFLSSISAGLRIRWQDDDYREKQAKHRSLMPKVSQPQLRFYTILDNLGLAYYREYNDRPDDPECRVGFYSFDCRIPCGGSQDILVEVQGDYWHSLPETQLRDRQKRSYIENNFASSFVLKYVWEHELKRPTIVAKNVQSWVCFEEPCHV